MEIDYAKDRRKGYFVIETEVLQKTGNATIYEDTYNKQCGEILERSRLE